MINILKFDPTWDLKAIYGSAIKWVETGTFAGYTAPNCHDNYFYIFPNNLGSMSLFALLFKITSWFGLTNYFWVASIFNSFLIIGTIILSTLIAKNIAGKKAGLITLCCFVLMPVFYFMAPVFYTDSLSIFFPILSIYLFSLAKDQKNISTEIILYIFSAITSVIGALIKMPVLILTIAIFLTLLLSKKYKKFIMYSCVTIITFIIIFGGFNLYIYSNHLDKRIADEQNVSILYWIDLALHDDGRYNNDIFQKASDITISAQERVEFLKQDIKEVLKEKGFIGLLKLFHTKNSIFFGDGTLDLTVFLGDSPLKETSFHDYLIRDAKYYSNYKTYCTSIFLTFMLLMVLTVKQSKYNQTLLTLLLSIFGIALFLLIWETNSRYITTFVPFILICAGIGITSFTDKFSFFKLKRKPKTKPLECKNSTKIEQKKI